MAPRELLRSAGNKRKITAAFGGIRYDTSVGILGEPTAALVVRWTVDAEQCGGLLGVPGLQVTPVVLPKSADALEDMHLGALTSSLCSLPCGQRSALHGTRRPVRRSMTSVLPGSSAVPVLPRTRVCLFSVLLNWAYCECKRQQDQCMMCKRIEDIFKCHMSMERSQYHQESRLHQTGERGPQACRQAGYRPLGP